MILRLYPASGEHIANLYRSPYSDRNYRYPGNRGEEREMTAGTVNRQADRLVTVKAAARKLGWSADAIRGWVADGTCPAVRTPTGQFSLYASWIGDVLDSSAPGVVGDMTEVTRLWWAARGAEVAA